MKRFDKCLELARNHCAGGSECGGILHIVLDDGNVEDTYIDYCEDMAREQERQVQTALEIIALLRQMTVAERLRLYRSQ